MITRPYVTLSCAISLDGYLDDAGPSRLLLSNEGDFDRVDGVRARQDAILIGANTIRRDNPRLLIKSPARRIARRNRGLPTDPVKITITTSGELDPDAAFFTTGDAPKIVYTPNPVGAMPSRLADRATMVTTGADVDLGWLLDDLAERGIGRLLVEGGGAVLTQFLSSGHYDELQLAIAPVLVGDRTAPRFIRDAGGLGPVGELAEVRRLGEIALLRYVRAGALERSLARVLLPARAILLDFDGPVTPLLADARDRRVADGMRDVLADHRIEGSDSVRDTSDPLEILRWGTDQRLGTTTSATLWEACRRGEVDAAHVAGLTPGVDRLLDACRSAGLPVIMVSNNSAEAIETFLDRHRLTDQVAGIVARVPHRPSLMKPHPDPVQRALGRLGRTAADCVLIGDSVTDIEVGLTTGVPTIGFARDSERGWRLDLAGADVIIDDLRALTAAIAAR